MICPKCNAENTSGSICCSKCGNFLPKEQAEQNNTPVQEEAVPQEPVVENQENITPEVQTNEPVAQEAINQQPETVAEETTPVVQTQEAPAEVTPTPAPTVAPVATATAVAAKGKAGVIIVIALVAALLGVGGYLIYDKFIKESDNKTNDTTTTVNAYNYNDNTNTTTKASDNKNTNNDDIGDFKSYDNYRVEVTMTAEISGIEMEMITKGVVDEVNQADHMVMTTKSMGISLDTEMYYDFKNGYTYTSVFGSWMKQKEATHIVDLAMLLKELKEGKNATKVDDNHYRLTISANDVQGVLDSSTTAVIKTNGQVGADIYIEDGYITKIDYDFSKILEGMDYTTSIKLYDYNKAGTVEIPASVINGSEEE